ncbi:rod shape-determining protein MreC [Xanthomonas sp. NCPPB 2654]|uniref:rod shape-determining protein MreC n=1 Tax=unclassified Xanthomonas TaxID=2643310 RepID=UPI0021DFC6E6|nr:MULTISPECIES: rod shape-determining protein MreC [unclassified Xanthomonas]MDL5367772.1 rod shape-determining protein MreC [Xanthomonas sp. NCPPB 2654]UYC20026.1 rod shape-determining protein MreC [Xanthomonas sp. CFBP 8443]
MPPYAGPPVTARPGEAASTPRLLAYLALAVVLIVLDAQAGWLKQVRSQTNLLVQPLWALAGLPGRLGSQVQENAASHAQLVRENRALRNELLIAKARLTRLQTAALDNAQLRELLGVAERRGLDVQLAPILDIDLDPTRQRLVLDAGGRDGVHVGQAVIDAGGLMGQVIEVTPLHSTVLLLTDPDHAVPVTVARNGVRLIVYGRGDTLQLRDVPLSAGVEVGDEIVTSGLGGRFPAGFPVGTVSALRPDDTHAFLVGDLKPAAKLDRGRDVLLLRPSVAAAGPGQPGESGPGTGDRGPGSSNGDSNATHGPAQGHGSAPAAAPTAGSVPDRTSAPDRVPGPRSPVPAAAQEPRSSPIPNPESPIPASPQETQQ